MILRKLWAWEREQMRAHLLRLDAQDRRLRFGRAASDETIHRYCDRIDWPRTTVVSCFAGESLRGIAELVRLPGDAPVGAEVALSVDPAFRGRGVGAGLLGKTLMLARNRFVDTVFLLALAENEPVRRLARRFGASITTYADTSAGRIRLPWPSCLSLMEEAGGDGQALIGAVLEPAVEALAH